MSFLRAGLKTPLHKQDWHTKRFKFLFKKISRPLKEDDGVVTAFRDGVVTLRSNRREDGFTFADKEIGYQGVEPNDLVIHAMDGFAGAIGVSNSRGKCSPVYSIIVPRRAKESFPNFWGYYLRNLALSGFIESLAKGIRERSTDFRWKDVGNLLVNFPDYETQKEIAEFLDRETALIDRLIEKKEKVLEMIILREQAFIQDLLKGKDIICPRKIINIDWIKDIPSHWRTIKLRYLVAINTGSKNTQDKISGGKYPFFVRSMKVERINTFSMNKEAVLTSGDGAGVGEVFHHIFDKFDYHQRMYAFTDFKEISGDYFFYFLKSFFKLQMSQYSAKSTVDSVRMPFLKSMLFTIPPLKEQNEIALKIKSSLNNYKLLGVKVQTSIKKLKELRASLITEAVTGQLDITAYRKRKGSEDRLNTEQTGGAV